MLIFHELIADSYVEDTNTRLTKIAWAATMGNFDAFRLMVVANRVSGTSPILTVVLFEDPDMSFKLTIVSVLVNVLLNTGQENVLSAAVSATDLGATASYGRHLGFSLSGTSPKAHVRIWATGRGRA